MKFSRHVRANQLRTGDLENDQSQPLFNEDNVTDENPNFADKDTPRSGSWRQFAIHTASLLSLFLALTLVFVALKPAGKLSLEPTKQDVMIKPCGSSPEEARQRGCHFDIISFCWLHPTCYDAELSQSFDDENNLEWSLDPERNHLLNHDQIMTGEFTGLYVNWEYHLRHCTAMWKKLHRAINRDDGKKHIDSYIGSYEHTKHCEHMLLSNRELEAINTRIAVKYPDCGV